MKLTPKCQRERKRVGERHRGKKRERGREGDQLSENVYFHTLKFRACASVCVRARTRASARVLKINRPCDEQPVPRWKYILRNTTVVCRSPCEALTGEYWITSRAARGMALWEPLSPKPPRFRTGKKKKRYLLSEHVSTPGETQTQIRSLRWISRWTLFAAAKKKIANFQSLQ